MTAAGTIPPAKVLVLGAGVAGLQAIATAKRLGAKVSANDVRAASADEVASMGGTFIHLDLDAADASGRLRQGARPGSRASCSATCSPRTSPRPTSSSPRRRSPAARRRG